MSKEMKRDQKLVSLFLDEYKNISGEGYQVKEWADDKERNKPAVEAIAVDQSTEKSLAIEHTLLQPFEGEKNDNVPFLMVVGELEKDDSLKLPKYSIDIFLQVGAIPKGVKWPEVNKTFGDWLRQNIANLQDGESKHVVRHNDLEIQMTILKDTLPSSDKGTLTFGRFVPPDSLPEVMRTAFKKKLPKLVDAAADKRILLFENDGLLLVNKTIYDLIGTLAAGFDELKKVDEIWMIGTMGWKAHNYLTYTKVWPDVATWVNGQLQ
jgi:hypothetical protein